MMMIEDADTEAAVGIVQVDMTFKLLARRLSGGKQNERTSKPTLIVEQYSETFPGEN